MNELFEDQRQNRKFIDTSMGAIKPSYIGTNNHNL